MANTKYNHVWVIDTASASVETEFVSITTIRWVGTAGGAGGVEMTDLDTKFSPTFPVIWAARVATGEVNLESNHLELMLPKGFGVPTLLAGTKLYVYLSTIDFAG